MASQRRQDARPAGTHRAGRTLFRILVVLSVIVVGIYLGLKLAARRPTTAADPVRPSSAGTAAAGDAAALERKADTWTFLLAAKDQSSGNTDTIMVCTYDTKAQTVGLVSLPRDTLVDREGWKYHKLNGAYPSGNKADPPDGGIRELMAAAGEIVGFPLDHYVLIDTEIFVELVDAIDGVDFDVPVHMSYDDPSQDLHIHYEPGLQHLTGRQALEVVRCRKNSDGKGRYPHNLYDAYPDADIGRTRTQQAMVKAIAKRALSKPHKLPTYVELFSEYVDTDLSLANLLWLMEPALKFDLDAGLTTATLPGDGTVTYKGITYCYALDIEGSLAIINDCLCPYTSPITEDMVKMIQG